MKKQILSKLLSFSLACLMLLSVCNLPLAVSANNDPSGFDDFEGCGIHLYNQTVVDSAYLATVATCTLPATYYYTCECGKIGTETFTYGATVPHTYSCSVLRDEYRVENPTDGIEFYYSCVCGAKGSQTFSVKSEDVIYTNSFDKYQGLDADTLTVMKGLDFSTCPSTATPVEQNGDVSM
ncbi:MAG: hypothetical protein IJX80_08510 [Clostridia bacterium]|nr:hypothetical protein [Clostridia bacterium]